MSRQSMLEAADLRRIIEIQNAIARASLDFEAVIRLIAGRARELTGASGSVIEIVDGGDMVYRAVSGSAEGSLGLRLRRDASLSGLCVEQNVPLRCDDAESDPRVDRDACRRVGLASMICVPLLHEGSAVGVLKVISAEKDFFDDRHEELIGLLAEIVAASMTHAAAFAQKHHDSFHDALTALPNRRAFEEAIREERSRALRERLPLSLVLLDLDGFKAVNDREGHPAGDAVLQGFAQALGGTKRLPDRAFRLGGDEFALLLPATDAAEAVGAVERIRAAFAASGVGGKVGVSAGASDAAASEPEEAYARADAALFADKAARKGSKS